MAEEHTGNTSLFAVFALSIYTLFLICYSLYQCYSWSENQSDAGWSKGNKQQSAISAILRRVFCKANISTFLLWGLWFLLFWYVSSSSKDLKPFDPYDILGLERTATATEVKKAYRKMSLQYHPDKNPDPAATKYFAEYITKAYKALTDDVARENWDKYGHPDGPQAMTMSVALPEWLFSKDHKMAPVMLLVLVGCGILLPLSVVSWYMLSSDQYEGPNRIMKGTYYNYMFDPKSCIKESMGIGRIPDTLVTAAEFIQMPTFAAQEPLVDDVWKAIAHAHPEYRDKKNNFWKRKGSVLKSHLLLLAYLERQVDDIPQPLRQDLNYVLQKTPLLLEEMVRISGVPKPPYGYGWLAPTLAAIEMMQSLIQAVPVRERKSGGRAQDNPAALLQLPHMDFATMKTLRSKEKVKSVQDLQTRTPKERRTLMQVVGMEAPQAEEVAAFVGALPVVQLQVECDVDGNSTIYEYDIVNCTIKVLLSRPNHAELAALPSGKSRPAVTSTYPLPYEESWFFLLADPVGNWVMASREKVQLVEAEAAAFKLAKQNGTSVVPSNGKPSDAIVPAQAAADADYETAQVVQLQFQAPKAGKYDLSLMCLSDCYVGCDAVAKVSLRVLPQTRAMAEGRVARQSASGGGDDAPAPAAGKAKELEKEKEKEKAKDVVDSEDEEEGSDEDEEEDEYDSEESGEEETDDES